MLLRAPAREPVEPEGVGAGGERGAGRAGPAEPGGEDEPGEGRRPDGVREEGEAAEDDPRPEQAGRDREHERLDEAALHEGVVEWREHC